MSEPHQTSVGGRTASARPATSTYPAGPAAAPVNKVAALRAGLDHAAERGARVTTPQIEGIPRRLVGPSVTMVGSHHPDVVATVLAVGVQVGCSDQPGLRGDPRRGGVAGQDAGDQPPVRSDAGDPSDDSGRGFGGNSAPPGSGVEAVEEAEYRNVREPHRLDATKAQHCRVGTPSHHPIADPFPLPESLPPAQQILGGISIGKCIRRVVRHGSRILVDAPHHIDVPGHRHPKPQPCGQQLGLPQLWHAITVATGQRRCGPA
jgi:hypothetical protein